MALRDSILRMYGGGKSGRYKQVEYIRKIPYSWIDNLLTINYDGQLELKVREEGDVHTGDEYVIKARNAWLTFNQTKIYGRYYNSTSRNVILENRTKPSTIVLNKDSLIINGSEMLNTFNNDKISYALSLASIMTIYIQRIYYIRYSKGNVLKHNFVPAMDKTTGKYGLLDTITNTFRTSDGSREFAGPIE